MSAKQQEAAKPAAEAPKPAAEAAPAPKAAAPRTKKKRAESPVYKFYTVSKSGKVDRLKKECPRCGRGVFLAEHKDRLTCGKCGYTSFKKK